MLKSILPLVIFASIATVADVIPTTTNDVQSFWRPWGCANDSVSSRVLNVASFDSDTSMSEQTCVSFCSHLGYSVAGTGEYTQSLDVQYI